MIGMFFWFYLECVSGSPKMNKNGFGARGHVQKSQIIEMRGLGFSHKEIEKFSVQIELE